MPFLNRLIPVLTPILIFATLEAIFWKPPLIYFFVLLSLLILSAATWKIIGKGLITIKSRWLYLLTPTSFLSSGVLFMLFLEKPWWKHLLAAALSVFIGIFLENIFAYIHQHEKYQPHSLENISNYLNLTSIFLFHASLLGFFVFLGAPLWELTVMSLIFSLILTYQTIWVNKISVKAAWMHISIICLVIVELFWTISFLPTAFYVGGLIIGTSFYLMNNLMRLQLLDALNKKVVKRYLTLCGLVIILTLATARWV